MPRAKIALPDSWRPSIRQDAGSAGKSVRSVPDTVPTRGTGLRTDAWYNARSKFGGGSDPVVRTLFSRNRLNLSRDELDALYEQDWLASRIVDKLAEDSTKEWILIHDEKDPKLAEDLVEQDRKLAGRTHFANAVRWSRLYGASMIVMGLMDGKAPEEPLDLGRIASVRFVHVVDRHVCFPLDYYTDPDSPIWGEVERYQIFRLFQRGGESISVHESRVIRFDGPELPPLAKIRNWGYGQSILEKVYDALRNWGVSNQAAAAVIPNFVTVAFQIGNLSQLLQNKDFGSIQARIAEFVSQLSVNNVAVFGEGESIQKMGTDVSGLPQLVTQLMQVVSAAADIPMSVLFQAQSGAMGGNAASVDVENWHNRVSSFQEIYLRPRVRRWLDVIGIPLGIKPGQVEFEFNPLDKLSALQEAELYQRNAQADQIYLSAGIIDSAPRLGVYRFGGKRYNPRPPVLDTTRQEKAVEKIDRMPVVLSSEIGGEPSFGEGFQEPDEPNGSGPSGSLTVEGFPHDKPNGT